MIFFKINKIPIREKGVLAPMQEFSNLPFRLLCKEYSAGLCFTEMVNINQIVHYKENLSKIPQLNSTNREAPCGVQVFGDFSKKKIFFESLYSLDAYKHFDIIDLNLGCPSLKIINSKSGAYNLKQLNKVLTNIKEISCTLKKPLTLKTRLGFSKQILENYLLKIQDSGVACLSVHARLAMENYSVPPRVELVKSFKEKLSIPLIYNGDVRANTLFDFKDFSGIMVAREALGNPFIFTQIKDFTLKNEIIENRVLEKPLKRFLFLENKYPISFSKFKVSILTFLKHQKGFSKIREKISCSKNKQEVLNILKDVF